MQTRSRVMIVEDNPADIMLIREGIKKCDVDYDCYYFSNGQEAINHLNYVKKPDTSENLPDVMIIDLNLPGKSGMDVLKEMKSDSTLKTIPIAIFSSMPYGNPLKVFDEKADMYYSKPFDVDEYIDLVCKICGELDKLKKART